MSADCKIEKAYIPLLAAYRDPTPLKNRVINQIAYQEIAKITEHNCPEIYDLIWNYFTSYSVPNLKKNLVMSKPGIKGTHIKQIIEQGEHVAPMRHPHTPIAEFWAYNPIQPRFTWSKYGEDRPQFQSDEDAKRAYEADVHAAEQAFKEFRKMVVCLFFQTIEEWKKFDCIGSSNDEVGINKELHDLWFKKTDDIGVQLYQQGLSIEKNFLCYKDGKPQLCCKADASCKPYKVEKNHLQDTLITMQKIIAINEIDGKKSDLPIVGTNGGNDSKYLFGWVKSVKSAVREISTQRGTKYNIGIKIKSDGTCCEGNAEICKTIKDTMKHWYDSEGRSLGLINKPGECAENCDNCCCCYVNQIMSNREDLTIFINPTSLESLEDLRLVFNFDTPDFSTGLMDYLKVGGLIAIPEIPDDKIFIIHKKAIQINPVEGGKIRNMANYDEFDLTNMWVEDKFHLTLWPYPCFCIKKPTS